MIFPNPFFNFLKFTAPADAPIQVKSAELFVWHRADNLKLNNPTHILRWPDKSGNSRDLVQTASLNQPNPSGSLNGQSAVIFDGDTDFLHWVGIDYATELNSTGADFFFVIQNDHDPAISGRAGGWGDFGITTQTHHPWTDGVVYDAFGSTVRKTLGNLTGSLTEPHIYNVQSFRGEWRVYYNGTEIYFTDNNIVGFEALQNVVMGKSDGAYFYKGLCAEVIGYKGKLTSADREQIQAYLTKRYTINTPDFGPYYQYGAVAHWDASQGITTTGSNNKVVRWNDKIWGVSLDQPEDAKRPILSGSDLSTSDGFSVLFDGSSFVSGANTALQDIVRTKNFSLGAVVKANDDAVTKVYFSVGNPAVSNEYTDFRQNTSERHVMAKNDSGGFSSSTAVTGSTKFDYVLYSFNTSTNEVDVSVNGEIVTTDTVTGDPDANNVAIGARVRNSYDLEYHGKIKEIVVFDNTLTGSSFAKVEGYLAATINELPYKPVADWDPEFNVETNDSGKVLSWTDKINGYIVSQSSDSNRPTYNLNSLNKKNTLEFVSINKYLQDDGTVVGGVFEPGNDYSIAVVYRPGSTGRTLLNAGTLGTNTDGTLLFYNGSGQLDLYRNISTAQWDDTTVGTSDQWSVSVLSYNNTNNETTFRTNGTHVTDTETDNLSSGAESFLIGARISGGLQQIFSGSIARLAIWNKALTRDQLESVSIQLNKLYNLDINTPAASPFEQYGAIAHWDARYGVVQESNEARKWIDRIGSYAVSQSTSANRPTWSNIDNVFYDTYSVDFESSNTEWFVGTEPTIMTTLSSSHTIMCLIDVETGTATNAIFAHGSSDQSAQYVMYGTNSTANARWNINSAGSEDVNGTSSVANAALLTFHFDPISGDVQVRTNGVTEGTGNTTKTILAAERFAIGNIPRNTTNFPYDGKIRDIVVFDTWLTGSDLTNAENVLMQ